MNSFEILSRLQSGTETVVRLDEALAAIAEERKKLDVPAHAPLAVIGIDCRTCEHWDGKWCNRVAQCVDADLYRQGDTPCQTWKRSEK